ncbi:MAG TPA: polymer-forming cytoskeletal protein [Patescibacteria group bacterium]|nr:polymer-forming cytoskeletal protein [Patescibacteria group bacterium]
MFKGDNMDRPSKNVETIIGPSVKVEGDFNGDGDVIVEGIVVGNLTTKNHLKVGKGARVQAKVTAQSAFIAGEIIGNITAEERIELTASARVKGDITTNSLSIEKGARVNGKITMNGQKKTEPAEASVETKSK